MINTENLLAKGGGNGPFTLSGFVSNTISKALADRLLSNTYNKKTSAITLYISNLGDDEVADGSESKPFKTYNACMNYAQKNLILNYNVNISFLTDFEETGDYRHSIRNLNIFGYLTIEGNNHKVVLNPFDVYQGYVQLSNLTIKNKIADKPAIYTAENAFVIVNNFTSIDEIKNSGETLFANRTSTIWLRGKNNSFTVNKSNRSVIRTDLLSNVVCDDVDNIQVNGKAYSLFSVKSNSTIAIATGNFTGSFTGKQYYLERNSCLDLFGRGTGILVGSDGTKDESSIIC